MSQVAIYPEMEIRKLKPAELYTLGEILNISDSWKKLMAVVPKEGVNNFPKFNSDHFSIIEQAAQRQRRNAAEIFLEEWGTMGRNRPTLQTLLDLLVKAELFRAADYVAGDLLKEELPKRPEHGPAARIEISEEMIRKLLEEQALCGDGDTEEPIILGSSLEMNLNQIVYDPEASLNAGRNSSLETDTRSTKLASELNGIQQLDKGVVDNNCKPGRISVQEPKEISDLMKFSTGEILGIKNNPRGEEHFYANRDKPVQEASNFRAGMLAECESGLLPTCIEQKEELPSVELPVFLSEFGKNKHVDHVKLNLELNSDSLPLFLTKDSQISSNSSLSGENLSRSAASNKSNSYVAHKELNKQELKSAELPEFVVQLNSNGKTKNLNNNIQFLASQELPVTVQEYH